MKQVRRLILLGVMISIVLPACAGPVGPGAAATASPAEPPAFVGKTWMSTDASVALGTLRIFLPDGTLVMDSCGETYRLERWVSIDDGRIAWQEDSARIEAEIAQATPDELLLRLHLVNEIKEERYRLAQVPYLCPDLRPNPAARTFSDGRLIFVQAIEGSSEPGARLARGRMMPTSCTRQD